MAQFQKYSSKKPPDRLNKHVKQQSNSEYEKAPKYHKIDLIVGNIPNVIANDLEISICATH